MTTLEFARLQFALTAGLHCLFVSLTLGLAPLIAVMQTRYAITGNPIHRQMTRYWGQLYLINYGVGIITGLVMEFQFGLNWNGLSQFAGNVFGAPLALETLIAFFLESTFLGMWIFGWGRLPRYMHLVLIWLVTVTAYVSAFWIMVANGFLQHPVGGVVRGGVFQLTDFGALLTNREALGALQHLLPATSLAGALFVAGVSAWQFLRGAGEREFFLRSLRLGLLVAAPMSALAINRGFEQIGYLTTDQSGKMAQAFGDPNPAVAQAMATARYGPGHYLPPSWLEVPANIMLYSGYVMGVLSVLGAILVLGRGWLIRIPILLRLLSWLLFLPFLVVLCGWVVREEGRQPWLVYGLLRTSDAVSPATLGSVITSFAVFIGLLMMLVTVDVVVMRQYAGRGPGGDGILGAPDRDAGVDTDRALAVL